MALEVSQVVQPKKSLSFDLRGEQHVIVACEIWRRTPKGFFRFVNIKPYYKFDIDTSILNKNQLENLQANVERVKGKVERAVDGWSAITSSGVNNTLIGLQIDESSRFGTKVEISFSDYERLLYKVVRTDDVMFLWVMNMSKDIAMAGATGAGSFGTSKLLFYQLYNNDVKFKVGVKSYLSKTSTSPSSFQSLTIKNTKVVNQLCRAGLDDKEGLVGKAQAIADKLTHDIDRKIPHFGGFITVKNFHIGGSAQCRMNAQDPARMFQHLKIDYGFDYNDKEKDEPMKPKDYAKNKFWSMVSQAAKFCQDNGMVKIIETPKIANDPESFGKRPTGIFDVQANKFFRALLDRVYASTRKVDKNDKDMLLMAFDSNIEKLFGRVKKDKTAKIRFLYAKDSNFSDSKIEYYLDLKVGQKASGTMPLAISLTKSIQGRASERWTPDKIDLYTKPELDTSFAQPSIIDFINMWVANFIYHNKIIYGDATRNLWVKSNMFINQDVISDKKGTGMIITLLFTFSGRDTKDGALIVNDRKHTMFLDEIAELDVFEINRRGQVSQCLLVDDDDENLTVSSCKLKHNMYKDTIYSHNPKLILFDTTKPLVKYGEKDGTNVRSSSVLVNTIQLSREESYYIELQEKVEAIRKKKTTDFLKGSFSHQESQRVADNFDKLGIVPNDRFAIEFDFSTIIGELLAFGIPTGIGPKQNPSQISLKYGGKKPFVIKSTYGFDEFFKMCEAFLTDKSIRTIGQKLFGTLKDIGQNSSGYKIEYGKGISSKSSSNFAAKLNVISKYLDDHDKVLDFLSGVISYDKTALAKSKWKLDNDWNKKIAWNSGTIKTYLIRLIFTIIELGIRTTEMFLYDLSNTQGRNGSLYMAAQPNIQIGDTIYLVESKSNWLSLASRYIQQNKPNVDTAIKYASAFAGNVKPLASVTKDKYKKSKGIEYYKKDIQDNGEGTIFVDDTAILQNLNPEGEEVPRWFVYRHVIYIGNFGTTSGFMSKIYLVDEPINSNMPFDEDNVVTRQLSTFLHRSSLGENVPLSWRRMI